MHVGVQVEGYGAEYQHLSWGELIKMVKADTNIDRQQITWTKEKVPFLCLPNCAPMSILSMMFQKAHCPC